MQAKKPEPKSLTKEEMFRKIMPSTAEYGKEEDFESEIVAVKPDWNVPIDSGVPCNLIEFIVLVKADDIIKRFGGCTCERCRNEVIAQALNNLPPFYAVTNSDEAQNMIKKIRAQFEIKIVSAIITAAQKLIANPKH